jgi:Holliday junction resolvasome RuvABC DNA-binding subunit
MLGLISRTARNLDGERAIDANLETGHLKLQWKRVRLESERNKPPAPWDDDLSEHDMEALTGAGWSPSEIRETVEKLQRMVRVLVKENP